MVQRRKLTFKEVHKTLKKTCGGRGKAAELLKVHPNTIARYIKRYPSLAEIGEKMDESRHDSAIAHHDKLVRKGDQRAVEFELKNSRRSKARGYGAELEVKHSGTIKGLVEYHSVMKDPHIQELVCAITNRIPAPAIEQAAHAVILNGANGNGKSHS